MKWKKGKINSPRCFAHLPSKPAFASTNSRCMQYCRPFLRHQDVLFALYRLLLQ